jgi:hypothetical protein
VFLLPYLLSDFSMPSHALTTPVINTKNLLLFISPYLQPRSIAMDAAGDTRLSTPGSPPLHEKAKSGEGDAVPGPPSTDYHNLYDIINALENLDTKCDPKGFKPAIEATMQSVLSSIAPEQDEPQGEYPSYVSRKPFTNIETGDNDEIMEEAQQASGDGVAENSGKYFLQVLPTSQLTCYGRNRRFVG